VGEEAGGGGKLNNSGGSTGGVGAMPSRAGTRWVVAGEGVVEWHWIRSAGWRWAGDVAAVGRVEEEAGSEDR
jgi:hypothetical protein